MDMEDSGRFGGRDFVNAGGNGVPDLDVVEDADDGGTGIAALAQAIREQQET